MIEQGQLDLKSSTNSKRFLCHFDSCHGKFIRLLVSMPIIQKWKKVIRLDLHQLIPAKTLVIRSTTSYTYEDCIGDSDSSVEPDISLTFMSCISFLYFTMNTEMLISYDLVSEQKLEQTIN